MGKPLQPSSDFPYIVPLITPVDCDPLNKEVHMPQPRKRLVDLKSTPYYHCITRCVRRAWLCGEDPLTGQCYDHRRGWVVNRLRFLSAIFAIDVCAYAVMSNHSHVVVHIAHDRVDGWSNREVIERWERLFGLPKPVQNYLAGSTSSGDREFTDAKIRTWRKRLADLSWFMKCLNEYIARRANAEECCTGHFWESRFKSQPLLNESALLACMAYVDLNPIRSGAARTPEFSDFTSIQARIQREGEFAAIQKRLTRPGDSSWLLPFSSENHENDPESSTIPFKLQDYLQLVDWTGRVIRSDKPGAITPDIPPILGRLQLSPRQYLKYASQPDRRLILGTGDQIRDFARAVGKTFFKGVEDLTKLFKPDS